MRHRWFVPAALLVALIAVAAFLLLRPGLRPQEAGTGTPAPTFSAATADGSRKVSFPADLKGHWSWLMFSGLT